MRYLSIKNFAKYQHYKDRRPPWIKLHVEVLDDYAFVCLQDASKAHLMLLWVLASKMDNRIPYDSAFLARKLGSTTPIDVEELVLQGFIEISQDDSKSLAPRKRSAMPEGETETETEGEKNAAGAVVDSPPDPFPKVVCDAGWEQWTRRIGSLNYGRFRKALLPTYQSLTAHRPSQTELVDAIEAFARAKEQSPPAYRGKYTISAFAESLQEWVGRGGEVSQPIVDEFGELTAYGERLTRPDKVPA